MPEGATIEIEGLDELMKKLDDLKQLRKVHAGIRAAGIYVKGKIAKYPARKHIKISDVGGWKSEKQRRWFFANLRKGTIDVPYKRTTNLAKKWTSKYDRNKFEAVVGNNASYARFVQGDKQTKMMKMIGWETVDQVADKETKRVQEYVFEAVRRAIGA